MKFTWFLALVLITTPSYAQFPDRLNRKMGLNPIIYIDSVESTIDVMKQLSPLNISNITILTMKAAKKRIGEKGADGAIYITTINYAKENYWKFLCGVSVQYKQLIAAPAADSIVQYTLNQKRLTAQAAPGELFFLNKKNFKRLQIRPDTATILGRYIVAIKAKPFKNGTKLSSFK